MKNKKYEKSMMDIVNLHSKTLILCLIVVLSLIMTGCAQNGDYKDENSNSSPTASGEGEGIYLPDVEFDSPQQTNSDHSNNTSKSDDDKTLTSSQDSSKQENSSSSESSDEESEVSSDDTSDDASDDTSEDTPSDDASVPSENNDGIIELPMDKW